MKYTEEQRFLQYERMVSTNHKFKDICDWASKRINLTDNRSVRTYRRKLARLFRNELRRWSYNDNEATFICDGDVLSLINIYIPFI